MGKMREQRSVKRTYTIGSHVAERFERLIPQGKRSETVDRLIQNAMDDVERMAIRDLVVRGLADMADVYADASRDWSAPDSEGWPAE